MYTEIEKIQKKIPYYVPLLGVLATLTKKVHIKVLEKTGFYPDYQRMQTLLNRLKILRIHCFMEHAKSSCLDLQFVLLKVATKASNIQKTIIFVNNISKIRLIINVFQRWMIKLGYPEESYKWIRPYHSAISDWDKALIADAFNMPEDENTKCTIIIAINANDMGIDNPGVKFVIQ